MTVASFVISVLAFVVSGATFGWNLLNYLLTGQRAQLRVSSMRALNTETGTEMQPFLQVTVSATGRVPVEVTGWSLAFPDDLHLHSALIEAQYGNLSDVYLGDKLPEIIQPGRSGSFNLPTVAIKESGERYKLDLGAGHIQVYFAARKPLRDKKSVTEYLRGKAVTNKDTDRESLSEPEA
jgi:hypothetical protein